MNNDGLMLKGSVLEEKIKSNKKIFTLLFLLEGLLTICQYDMFAAAAQELSSDFFNQKDKITIYIVLCFYLG